MSHPRHPDESAHPHAHQGHDPERGTAPADPYPFVYSRDVFDRRRYMAPGDAYGPAQSRLPRMGVIVTWAILLGIAALFVVSVFASLRH